MLQPVRTKAAGGSIWDKSGPVPTRNSIVLKKGPTVCLPGCQRAAPRLLNAGSPCSPAVDSTVQMLDRR